MEPIHLSEEERKVLAAIAEQEGVDTMHSSWSVKQVARILLRLAQSEGESGKPTIKHLRDEIRGSPLASSPTPEILDAILAAVDTFMGEYPGGSSSYVCDKLERALSKLVRHD